MSNLPLEIEYKFLIEMPDLNTLKAQPDFKEMNLTQMYLLLPEGVSEHGSRCRIRKTELKNKTVYFKTFKSTLSHMTRVEIESEITQSEYTELSQYLLKGTVPVSKTRISFLYSGYTCEVDIFPFWEDRAFMEIEVKSESDTPPIPDFIKVIKDVTCDKAYRNSSIAKMLFDGTINTL